MVARKDISSDRITNQPDKIFSARKIICALSVLLFILSDYYFQGIGRGFDYLYIAIISLFGFHLRGRVTNVNRTGAVSLCITVLPWLAIGAYEGYILITGAWLVGILLVYYIIGGYVHAEKPLIDCYLGIGLWLSIFAFFIQICLQWFFGFYLDYHRAVGSIQSRGWNDESGFFRPSGLFQEPNAYATVTFAMVSARVIGRGYLRRVDILAIFSILLSQSLWGLVASLILFVIGRISAREIKIFSSLVFAGACLAVVRSDSIQIWFEDSITLRRINNIDEDSSRKMRFGRIEDYLSFDNKIFGIGVNGDQFQSYIAVNGYAFLYVSFGIIGCLAIMIWLLFTARVKWRSLLVVIYIFTTYPQTSYLYFWLWLPMILNGGNNLRSAEKTVCAKRF